MNVESGRVGTEGEREGGIHEGYAHYELVSKGLKYEHNIRTNIFSISPCYIITGLRSTPGGTLNIRQLVDLVRSALPIKYE